MRTIWRHQTWIVLAGAVVMFTHLGATRLWDDDEAYFAATAAEMHARGEWVVPYFNGDLFAHKPPLAYWAMRVGFGLFGPSELGARFFSAVFAIATALVTYHLGRRLFCPEVGLWAGLAMTSCLMFDVVGRAATPDSFLVFFSSLAMYVFVAGRAEGSPVPASWRTYAAMYALMGLAVLVKGPIGVLLPTAAIGLYLVCARPLTMRNVLASVRQLRPLTALVVIALVAGPWFVMVGIRTGGTFWQEFFGVHNVGRFLEPMENHKGPIVYYLPAILIGFFPWSIFALPVAIHVAGRIRQRGPWHLGYLFITCWAAVWVVFFSLAATKLPNYVLPAYPALSLMTAAFLHRLIHEPAAADRWWLRAAYGILGLVGLAMAVVFPLVARWRVGEQSLLESAGVAAAVNRELTTLGWLGIVLLAGATLCMVLAGRGRVRASAGCLAVTSIAFVTCLLAGAVVRADRYQTSEAIAGAIRAHSPQGREKIGQYRYSRPSVTYYTGKRVEPCGSIDATGQFLADSESAFLVTTEKEHRKLAAVLPPDVVVLERRPSFPKSGTIVLLGRSSRLARRATFK